MVSQAVSVASKEVASRSHSSSRPVEGVVVSHSDMDSSIDRRCLDAGFVGMILDDIIRMLHDSLNDFEDNCGLEWLTCYHLIV